MLFWSRESERAAEFCVSGVQVSFLVCFCILLDLLCDAQRAKYGQLFLRSPFSNLFLSLALALFPSSCHFVVTHGLYFPQGLRLVVQ